MSDPQLSVRDLAKVMACFAEALDSHKALINALNVYPVPDGDTGTNMSLTALSVCSELDQASDEAGSICGAISHGSLMGARGNSGVIMSQILRGIAETVRDAGTDEIDAALFAAALRQAATSAYGAVLKPVEGTILTVVRECADAAEAAVATGANLVDTVAATRHAGGESLARTPELLEVLAEAGVVDAGATGLLLLLDAMLTVLDGRPLPQAPDPPQGVGGDRVRSPGQAAAGAGAGEAGQDISDLRYEVMFFLEAPDETIAAFKDVWAGIGDSIVVVGGEGLWNCHIHTDDIGASLEAAIDCGRPRDIRITDLLEQVEEERWVREASPIAEKPAHADDPVRTAVVAVATGSGVSRIFYSLGVQRIVQGGQTMNPSTAQLLEVVEDAPSDEVVILPNNKNIIPVAEQVDLQTDKVVKVVGTTGVTEGFASLLSYDPEAPAATNARAMADAAEAVVAGEVTQAVRDSACDLGPITTGDWIGIGPDGICAVAGSLDEAAVRLLDAIVDPDHELVTVIEGEGASDAVSRRISLWLGEHHPEVGTEVHHGGQPLYPYLFGIE